MLFSRHFIFSLQYMRVVRFEAAVSCQIATVTLQAVKRPNLVPLSERYGVKTLFTALALLNLPPTMKPCPFSLVKVTAC